MNLNIRAEALKLQQELLELDQIATVKLLHQPNNMIRLLIMPHFINVDISVDDVVHTIPVNPPTFPPLSFSQREFSYRMRSINGQQFNTSSRPRMLLAVKDHIIYVASKLLVLSSL